MIFCWKIKIFQRCFFIKMIGDKALVFWLRDAAHNLFSSNLDQFLIAIAINKVAFRTWSKFHLIKFRPSEHNLIFFYKMMRYAFKAPKLFSKKKQMMITDALHNNQNTHKVLIKMFYNYRKLFNFLKKTFQQLFNMNLTR